MFDARDYCFRKNSDWKINHDNASAHASKPMQRFLAKYGIKQFQRAPKSRDMASAIFCSLLKIPYKEKKFKDREKIKRNLTTGLMVLTKTANRQYGSQLNF